MKRFTLSGRAESNKLMPKNVPRIAPKMVVAQPSVMTRFIMPAIDLESLRFNRRPRAMRINP